MFQRSTHTAACLLLFPLALPAHAQDTACQDRIAAMFDGGALDPYTRPAHNYTNTVLTPDGDMRYQFFAIWDSPARRISGVNGSGSFVLIIDNDSWTGPSPEGPWTAAPNMLPENYDDVQRRQQAQMVKNLSETACPGRVEVDDIPYENVRFFTKTDPEEASDGAWFGSRNSVFIDPDDGRVMRWEMTDFVSSFAPEVSRDIHVQIFTYDDPISISRPD